VWSLKPLLRVYKEKGNTPYEAIYQARTKYSACDIC